MATESTDLETEYVNSRLGDSVIIQYPHKFVVDLTIPEYRAKYDYLTPDQVSDHTVSISGRIYNIRQSSKKLTFLDLQGGSLGSASENHLQVMLTLNHYGNPDDFEKISMRLARGDIIGIRGHPTRTKRSELSILPQNITILSPCLHTLPRALVDPLLKHSKRYLDLMINLENRQIFINRSNIIRVLRKFLDERGFLEVETPILDTQCGGATAKPFITHHNDLKKDMFMRIAPELALKRLVISGFDRVYEIGKQFRNETIDLTHNPEFTSCEFYCAYMDYQDLQRLTEELLPQLVKSAGHETLVTTFSNSDGTETNINWEPPYRVLPFVPTLEKLLNTEFPKIPFNSDEMRNFLIKLCDDHSIQTVPPYTANRLLDALFSALIEPTLLDPTFVTDHPLIMCPLAKKHRDNAELTERFELYVNGKELCNAYTELNNPVEQRDRFALQQKDRESGDTEITDVDKDFCEALEYGLPPTAGWGMGIDRLVMFLTNQNTIKNVI